MFFQFSVWNQTPVVGPPPPPPTSSLDPPLATIEAFFRLHPRTIMEALELFFATRAVPPGYPDYSIPAVFRAPDLGAPTPNLRNQITGAPTNLRFEHAMYGYLIENTRTFEIFDRVVREYEAGERFETPDPDTALWLRTTEALFYRDLPSGSVFALTSWLRPDLRSIRRNTYYRLLGLDLNHGLDGNRAYNYVKPQAANRDFVPTFEAFLREVWRGAVNAANPISAGPNETDNAAIADHVRRLREMLLVRRNNGNLVLEEFWTVVTMAWFHLTLYQDTPVVRALKAEAESPGERLHKLGERVGVPAHARADNYFTMAFPISEVLNFIETDPNPADPALAHSYYVLTGPHPELAANLRTIITHWSAATGRDVKGTRVLPAVAPPVGASRPQLMRPVPTTNLPNRMTEAAP